MEEVSEGMNGKEEFLDSYADNIACGVADQATAERVSRALVDTPVKEDRSLQLRKKVRLAAEEAVREAAARKAGHDAVASAVGVNLWFV
jgi:hypothetical protein